LKYKRSRALKYFGKKRFSEKNKITLSKIRDGLRFRNGLLSGVKDRKKFKGFNFHQKKDF